MGAMLQLKVGMKNDRVILGSLVSFGGLTFPLATDLEEHYLEIRRQDPANDWIWNRLGNAYHRGGRADLAVVAYEESVKRDPGQTESHYSLGKILFEAGAQEEAAYHLRRMLHTARDYEQLEALALRDLLTEGLRFLFKIFDDAGKLMEFLLKTEEGLKRNSQDTVIIHFVEFDISFDEFDGLYPLAEAFMGKRQKELPSVSRTLPVPEEKSGRGIHPKMKKKPKKKKKNKR